MAKKKNTEPATIFLAVLVTLMITFFGSQILIWRLKAAYEATHTLAIHEYSFLGIKGAFKEPVTFGMLEPGAKVVVFAFVLIFPFLHPFIGKAFSTGIHGLVREVDRVFELSESRTELGDWSHDTKIMVGALWPITMLSIPFLLIGIVFGEIYSHLWRK